jgi:hypothetical protein
MRSPRILAAGLAALVLLGACSSAATTAPTAAPTAAPTPAPATPAPAAAGASLSVGGLVATPLSLSEADLRALGPVQVTADHPKTGSHQYEVVRLSVLFEKAAVKAEATTVVLTGADGFAAEVPMADVKACADCMVAFGDPGQLVMVMPGMSGKAWVKGVVKIEAK